MLRLWDPATMDCLLLLAPITTSIGYAAKGDFSMGSDGDSSGAERGRSCPSPLPASRCAMRGCSKTRRRGASL
jgi:hypothetical protein